MRRTLLIPALMIVALVTAILLAPSANARTRAALPAWAPAASAAVHPGVQTFTSGAQCTANFIFTDGSAIYIGQAAHCAGTGSATDTNGCTAQSLPLGTKVDVTGATKQGTIVYSSWLTMQQLGEHDANTCAYNDLAIIALDPADYGRVNPSIPHWGGPTGVNSTGTAQGEQVYSYGNSELRFGVTVLSPKTGVTLGTDSGGWNDTVYTVTPGIPGDSGSAFLDSTGRALGILSTVQLAPLVAANGVGNVSSEVSYMHAHSSFGAVNIAVGTEPFDGSQPPLG